MPDTRKHRGPHPQDAELFREVMHPVLREAVAHLSWLLTRGYAVPSSLKLVGDRFALLERQRRAVIRSACSDQSLVGRVERSVPTSQLSGATLDVDGFNLLTTLEAALSGGILLVGRDGCLRDMASMHGSYRRVEETLPALCLVGEFLESYDVGCCRWWLDEPVSNSGRLRAMILDLANDRNWPWEAALTPDPDAILRASNEIVVTADGPVLDACDRWYNLAHWLVTAGVPKRRVVDLHPPPAVC